MEQKEDQIKIPKNNILNNQKKIEKYQLSEEDTDMAKHLNILNIYQRYYNTQYRQNMSQQNMFEYIDNEDLTSTNKCMETFYEIIHVHKLLEAKDEAKLFDPNSIDMDLYEMVYCVIIGNDIRCVSPSLYLCLKYLAEIENIWKHTWNIITLKEP